MKVTLKVKNEKTNNLKCQKLRTVKNNINDLFDDYVVPHPFLQ